MNRKLLLIVFMLMIMNIQTLSAVTVIDSTKDGLNNFGSETSLVNWDLVITIVGIGILGLIFITIIWKLISWFVKKIKEGKREQSDYTFFKYQNDLRMIHINKKPQFKMRNPMFFWMIWKKAKVYANTEDGLRLVGYYDGEAVKKEGFFIMGLEQRHSFFKRETDVVLFPYSLRKELIKYNDDFTITLNCEGVDEVLSSELFSIPVFKNTDNKNKDMIFADFSNLVMTKYFKEYVYKDVIRTILEEQAEAVRDATELNPLVQFKRKTGDDLKEGR